MRDPEGIRDQTFADTWQDANMETSQLLALIWDSLQPVAEGRAAARLELDRVRADGSTALLDAVSTALDVLDGTRGSANLQAVVALTDGEENSSSRTADEVERRLRHADALFFGIAHGDDSGRELLGRLARSCGGHSLVPDEHGIQAAYEPISRHL
jgi:Mg-chelatase subunit ChlD